MSEVRYAIWSKDHDINLFKDGRTYKNLSYLKSKFFDYTRHIDGDFYIKEIVKKDHTSELISKNERLEKQLQIYKQIEELNKKVRDFYGDKSEWCSWDVKREENKSWHITIADDEELVNEYINNGSIYVKYVGGKLAREISAQIEELKKSLNKDEK